MKLGIAQINTRVGDLNYNEKKIMSAIKELGNESDVIIFPEMTTTGYPPMDMVHDEDFRQDQKEIIYKVRDAVHKIGRNLTVILGYMEFNEGVISPSGDIQKFNSAAVISSQNIRTYHKRLLPNYGEFDERRYFTPGNDNLTIKFAGDHIGAVSICEDLWDDHYKTKPLAEFGDTYLDTIFNISSSPFATGKVHKRLALLKKHVAERGAGIAYVNQIGAQTDLIFDGTSMVLNKKGELIHIGKRFEEEITVVDMQKSAIEQDIIDILIAKDNYYGEILEALKLSIKDYIDKSGLGKVIIGISGGIDSAVTTYILSKVFPKERIHAIYMPTKHSHSLEFVNGLTQNIGIDIKIQPIDDIVEAYISSKTQYQSDGIEGVAYENLQARIRANILMDIANEYNGLVMNNSNGTELALSYGTMYGDLIGGYGLLGGLNKLEVYGLAKYINQIEGKDIFAGIIERVPTAELKEGQVDPFDYEKICEPVEDLLFGESVYKVSKKYWMSLTECIAFKEKIQRFSEYKRRQSMPIAKVKERNIGVWRRYPVVNGYKAKYPDFTDKTTESSVH